jgi:hypothetical protein
METVCVVDDILKKTRMRFPAVFATGKDRAIEDTLVPVNDKICTREMVDVTAGFTTMFSDAVAVCEFASVTLVVKVLVPLVVGVPVICPVLLLRVSPVGSVPVLIDQVYGVVPPDACNVAV